MKNAESRLDSANLTCVVDLSLGELREILLFAKAKRSKNF